MSVVKSQFFALDMESVRIPLEVSYHVAVILGLKTRDLFIAQVEISVDLSYCRICVLMLNSN